jgi:hypothetical protein
MHCVSARGAPTALELSEAERGYLYTVLTAELSAVLADLRLTRPEDSPAALDFGQRQCALLESLLKKVANARV